MRMPWPMVWVFLVLMLAGCGDDETPEDRVRGYIERVTESAEARKWRSFDNYVADDYSDDQGLSKKDVLGIVGRYILSHKSIHILDRVASIDIDEAGNAHAVVYAAMAGQPVHDPKDLMQLTADVYRFEIELQAGEDGVFRTRKGDWRSVSPEQFLIGR